MNAYFNNSNIQTGTRTGALGNRSRTGDGLISFICAIVAIITSPIAIRIEKVAVSTALFFAFFGLIGSMDVGSIGIPAGMLLCSLCVLFEFAILRSLASGSTHN